jgi:hypothetical protein
MLRTSRVCAAAVAVRGYLGIPGGGPVRLLSLPTLAIFPASHPSASSDRVYRLTMALAGNCWSASAAPAADGLLPNRGVRSPGTKRRSSVGQGGARNRNRVRFARCAATRAACAAKTFPWRDCVVRVSA